LEKLDSHCLGNEVPGLDALAWLTAHILTSQKQNSYVFVRSVLAALRNQLAGQVAIGKKLPWELATVLLRTEEILLRGEGESGVHSEALVLYNEWVTLFRYKYPPFCGYAA